MRLRTQKEIHPVQLLKKVIFMTAFFAASQVHAGNVQLSAKAGNWSFETENVRGRPESKSGFGAYSLEIGYSFARHFMGVVGANLLLSDGISGSSGFGVDAGFRYYPFTDATRVETKAEDTYITVNQRWRPYVGAFFRQRDFNIASQSGYVGPGVSVGLDYNISSNWLLSLEARYDKLYGSGESTATQMNFLIGVGVEI